MRRFVPGSVTLVEDTDPDVFGNGVRGIAPVMQELSADFDVLAFSVVSRECAATNWTLAHEVGHNQGCTDNREDASIDSLFSYSYGHRLTGNTRGWRTVMAYNDAERNWTRIGPLSNPNRRFNGAATGVPIGSQDEAHNVSTINTTRSSDCLYRSRSKRDQLSAGSIWPVKVLTSSRTSASMSVTTLT